MKEELDGLKLCPSCNKHQVLRKEKCSECGYVFKDVPTKIFTNKSNIQSKLNFINYSSSYETTIITSKLISAVGWVISCISLFILIPALSAVFKYGQQSVFANIITLTPAIGGFMSGLILIMGGQLTRAAIDNTNNSGEILALLKKMANKDT